VKYIFQGRKAVNRCLPRVSASRLLLETYDTNGLAGKASNHRVLKLCADRVYEKRVNGLVRAQCVLGHRNTNSTLQHLSFRGGEIDHAILAI
jgi:hypothetical protein